MRSKKIILLIIVCMLILTGCGKKENKPIVEEEPEKQAEVLPESKIKVVNVNSKSRPYAVMINNLAPARKYQSGLQDAYMVYEMLVEGGITRMMAIFKDKDTARIGSIRSSRHYYLDYVLENDAIYVHDGWSPQAKSDIATLGINNINPYESGIFWREDLPVAYEHTEFTNIDNVSRAAKRKGYRMTSDKELLLNYSEEEVELDDKNGSVNANNVDIKYSNYITTNYVYNPGDKLYYRSTNGVKHVDYVTNKQYTSKNIIIAYINNSDIANDTKGRQTLDNIGTGKGYYITNGKAVPITWQKNSRADQTVYKYSNGEEIIVNDGNTFIQIAPSNSATIK